MVVSIEWDTCLCNVFSHDIAVDYILKNILEDFSLFCEASDTPVLGSWWHLSWASKPGSPCLLALLPTTYGFLRFVSGVTPADLLVAEPFLIHVLVQALVGLQSKIYRIFQLTLGCLWYSQISISAHDWIPLHVGKSVNIRAILRYTGKIPT